MLGNQPEEYNRADAVFYDLYATGMAGDSRFYVEEATKAGSPVLELGCGTGRILIPIAQSGVEVVGLDRAQSMLAIAEDNIAGLGDAVQDRIELVEGDMRSFMLQRQFNLVMIPFRAFLHLMTPEDQRQALWRIRDHLVDGGRLVLNVFDPRHEFLAEEVRFPEPALRKHADFIRPDNGNRVVVWNSIRYDLTQQVINEDRIFDEMDADGNVVAKTYTVLNLRYMFRNEMQYLFELCGFEVEALYGDFNRGPFRYGGEQVWVARKV